MVEFLLLGVEPDPTPLPRWICNWSVKSSSEEELFSPVEVIPWRECLFLPLEPAAEVSNPLIFTLSPLSLAIFDVDLAPAERGRVDILISPPCECEWAVERLLSVSMLSTLPPLLPLIKVESASVSDSAGFLTMTAELVVGVGRGVGEMSSGVSGGVSKCCCDCEGVVVDGRGEGAREGTCDGTCDGGCDCDCS